LFVFWRAPPKQTGGVYCRWSITFICFLLQAVL